MCANYNSTLMSGQTLSQNLLQSAFNNESFSSNNLSFLLLNRYRRHMSFVDPTTVMQLCRRADQFLPDSSAACTFVKDTPSCTDIVQRINYLKLMVCYLGVGANTHIHIRMMILSFLVITVYTLFAYVVGKYFILPNVLYIASYIHIPSFEYGVTTIGLLISAPDLITTIAVCAKYSANGTLILSGMMGRALSCYAIGMAVISFHQKQCRLPGGRYTRTVLMVLAANVFTVIALYYKLENDSNPPDKQSDFNIKYCASFMIIFYVSFITFVILTSRRESRRRTGFDEIKVTEAYLKEPPKNLKGFRLFTYPLNPFANMPRKRWVIAILTPFWILSALQVPVIDLKRPLNGWSKYMACISVVIFPWHFWMLKVQDSIFYISMFVAVIISLALFMFTNPNKPPRYHGLFSIVGMVIGFSLYHVIDMEVNVLLYQVLAFTAELHLDIVSTVAFSTCFMIFTVIFCEALMDMHHPNLASGVVVGISMNQSFTALPSIIFQVCYDLHTQVGVSSHTLTCYVFLIVTIVVSLLSAFITNFQWRPSHGAFLVTIYIFFLVVVFLGGYDLTHPYGTHHAVTAIFEIEHASWA